jgi:hypothetical protein
MTEIEIGFLAIVVGALTVFAAMLAYASAVAGGSSRPAPGMPANANKAEEKLAA